MNKNLYEIIWCFIDEEGLVQTDEYGCEQYFKDYIYAPDEQMALIALEKKENFLIKPEIIQITKFVKEEQENVKI